MVTELTMFTWRLIAYWEDCIGMAYKGTKSLSLSLEPRMTSMMETETMITKMNSKTMEETPRM